LFAAGALNFSGDDGGTGIENPIASAFPAGSRIDDSVVVDLIRETRLYVVFIIPRSGSTWLTELAGTDGRLGTPQEWFNESWIHGDIEALGCRPPKLAGTLNINDYIRKTVRSHRSPLGAMGLQLSIHQTRMLLPLIDDPKEVSRDVHFFYLRRRNIVAQAISLYRSAETGHFHSYEKDPAAMQRFAACPYSRDRIEHWATHLLEAEQDFERLFATCEIRPERFFYEDIVADPDRVLDCMSLTVNNNGERQSVPRRDGVMRKISDSSNALWEKRFRAEARAWLVDFERSRPAQTSSYPAP
jgi:LPS sulfotransferase NodH